MTITALTIGGLLALLVFVGWLGFQVQPTPFPAYPQAAGAVETTSLPAGLPAPVERWYRARYGDRIPIVNTVVIDGLARIRPAGPVWLPARYRFTHDAGHGYRHYIEATWFGMPLLRVNERYVDGRSLMELPWATDQGPKIEQAANLGMWAELSSAAPSVLLTDPRVSWEPVDDKTATLRVPLGDDGATDAFTVTFGSLATDEPTLRAPRYRASDSPAKIEWIAAPAPDGSVRGCKAVGSATWADQGTPWAYFGTSTVLLNTDVDAYLRGQGL